MLPLQSQINGERIIGKYITNIYRKMFGVTIYKSWSEIFQLEGLLNEYTFSNIVELGTGFGSTTIFLGVQGHLKGIKVYGFDNKPLAPNVQKLLDAIGTVFECVDIFTKVDEIANLIKRPGRTLLYCDNGDKAKELEIWGAYLKPGDVVLVHDYTEEIKDADLDKACQKYNMERFEKEWFASYSCTHVALIKK